MQTEKQYTKNTKTQYTNLKTTIKKQESKHKKNIKKRKSSNCKITNRSK